MICPNCKECDLEMYEFHDTHNGEELIQLQNLWCPLCRYHCQHKVYYTEACRSVVWEETEE